MHIHLCAHPAANVSQMCTLMSKERLYNAPSHTRAGAQNTCSKVHATLTAKKMHMYLCTHTGICIRIHVHKNTHAHPLHCPNTLKNGYWDSKSIRKIRKHMYIHACVYLHMYTCIHICTFIHTHTYTYITHTYNMYICTHASTLNLERWHCSDCVRSPTWRHKSFALLLSKW